ncbi:MAG: hypothetical protein MHM6MM_006488, partial [Cercozoa sp. M6MM]
MIAFVQQVHEALDAENLELAEFLAERVYAADHASHDAAALLCRVWLRQGRPGQVIELVKQRRPALCFVGNTPLTRTQGGLLNRPRGRSNTIDLAASAQLRYVYARAAAAMQQWTDVEMSLLGGMAFNEGKHVVPNFGTNGAEGLYLLARALTTTRNGTNHLVKRVLQEVLKKNPCHALAFRQLSRLEYDSSPEDQRDAFGTDLSAEFAVCVPPALRTETTQRVRLAVAASEAKEESILAKKLSFSTEDSVVNDAQKALPEASLDVRCAAAAHLLCRATVYLDRHLPDKALKMADALAVSSTNNDSEVDRSLGNTSQSNTQNSSRDTVVHSSRFTVNENATHQSLSFVTPRFHNTLR